MSDFIDLFKKTDDEKQQPVYLPTKLFCIPMSEFNYFILCSILIFICYKKKYRLDLIIEYQRFFFNPIFNFDFFLIGMFFGIMNYVVQNVIEKKKSLIKERPYVKLPIIFLKYTDYKKNKNVFRFIFILCINIG